MKHDSFLDYSAKEKTFVLRSGSLRSLTEISLFYRQPIKCREIKNPMKLFTVKIHDHESNC